jgi:hypothetical protein
MRPFKFLSLVCAMTLMASFKLHADALVDDCNGNTNQNKFGYYWYFYDDSKDQNGGGSSSIPGVTKAANGDYAVAPTAAAGYELGGIVCPYVLGPTKAGSVKGYAYNYIGMGTMLCGNGKTIDLTGATTVSFWLKCDKSISVDFQLLDTIAVKDFGYFHALCPLTAGTWKPFTISLGTGINGLAQYAWAIPVTFSLKNISKIAWQIHSDNVGTNTSGTVTIDDIVLGGYTYIPPDLCPTATCAAVAGSGTGALLSDMETPPLNRNARGYYWYCYTDGSARGAGAAPSDMSVISDGATPNATDPTLYTINLITANTKGFSGTTGADIAFTLGKTFTKAGSSDVIKPFVGVGSALWNEQTTSDLYNATADNANGIYFDYKLNGSDSTIYLSMEVYDQNAITQPSPDVVHYIKLPFTHGNWQGAKVLFTSLVLPEWDGVVPSQLDATKLEKIQWKVQADAGVTGEVSIDNVYMLGASHITNSLAVKHLLNQTANFNGFKPQILNNSLRVTFNRGMNNGSITLINTKGEIVAKNIAAANQVAQYNIAGLSKGVYMLSVKASGKSGEFSKSVPLTIY